MRKGSPLKGPIGEDARAQGKRASRRMHELLFRSQMLCDHTLSTLVRSILKGLNIYYQIRGLGPIPMTPPATFVGRGGRETKWRSELSPAEWPPGPAKNSNRATRSGICPATASALVTPPHQRIGRAGRPGCYTKPPSQLRPRPRWDARGTMSGRGTRNAPRVDATPSWASALTSVHPTYMEARLYGEHKGGDPRTIAKARP